jgi:hypothetical protein
MAVVNLVIKLSITIPDVDLDSSVGTATRYELDGPGVESRLVPNFPHSLGSSVEPTQSPISWVPSLSHGGKAAGAWR